MNIHANESYVDTPYGTLWVRTVADPQINTSVSTAHPLLLLHGGPGYPSDYLFPLEELAAERTVIFFDQIGAGRSTAATDESAWTVNAHVEQVEYVRAHLGLEKMHVLGQSWGGFLALAYAQAHPDRIASLTLSSPLVDVDRWVEDANLLIAQLPDSQQQAIAAGPNSPEYAEAEAEFYRRHFCSIEPWPAPLQQSADTQGTAAYEAMWGPNEFTNTGSLAGASQIDTVKTLQTPLLWVTGSHDEARPETLLEFAALNTASEFVVLPGTHSIHLEAPTAYLDAVRSFLNRTDRTQTSH